MMNRSKKLLAMLPPPKTDPLPYGWLKRYLIDWFIPTALACIGVYLVAWRFVWPFANAEKENLDVVQTLLDSIVLSFSLSNSLIFHVLFISTGLVATALSISQYLKFSTSFPFGKRRTFHAVQPTTYWVFFCFVKLATVIATPLSLVLAAAVAAQVSELKWLATIYLGSLALVIAPIFYLMHHGLYAPFIYTFKVLHEGSSKELSMNAEQTSQWLTETYEQIAGVFGSIWSSSLIAAQDGKSGVLFIGLPQTLDEYSQETRAEFDRVKLAQKKAWKDRKFACDDFSESSKKRKAKLEAKGGAK